MCHRPAPLRVFLRLLSGPPFAISYQLALHDVCCVLCHATFALIIILPGVGMLSTKVNEWRPIQRLQRLLLHQPHNCSTVRYRHIIRVTEHGVEFDCHLLASLIF